MTDGIEELKKRAAEAAVALVESGMVVGLGFGSTASYALRRIGEKLAAGELSRILGVPTARAIEQQARELGIALTSLQDHPQIDLTIDGADEVDPNLDLIKGGGGALLWEKIVAQASRREIIVVDESKLSAHLGTRFPLPVEVIPFGWGAEARYLEALGATVTLRLGADGLPFETDQANWILDAEFGPIEDAKSLAIQLDRRAAVAGHGLFLGLATDLIVAGREGIQHIRKPGS